MVRFKSSFGHWLPIHAVIAMALLILPLTVCLITHNKIFHSLPCVYSATTVNHTLFGLCIGIRGHKVYWHSWKRCHRRESLSMSSISFIRLPINQLHKYPVRISCGNLSDSIEVVFIFIHFFFAWANVSMQNRYYIIELFISTDRKRI